MTPTVGYRTFFNVPVGLIAEPPGPANPERLWIVFPDGTKKVVNHRAYANYDEACAAEVAVWRKRRISRGIDKAEVAAPTPDDLFTQIRNEADSEGTVLVECGATGKYGATCYRKDGHEFEGTLHARAHIGRATHGEGDAKFVDDGEDHFEIWTTKRLVTVH